MKMTDFIVTDDFAQGGLVHDLLVQKKTLGLNHVIILHIPVTGVTVNPMLTAVQEAKFKYLKGLFGHKHIFMDELLAEYDGYPIAYAPEESCDTAFILHTSGTTGGAGKPVVLSDKAFNAAAPSGKPAGRPFHDPLGILGALFPDEDRSRKRSNMPEIPEIFRKALLKYGNRMIGMISTGRKSIDFDFEDFS